MDVDKATKKSEHEFTINFGKYKGDTYSKVALTKYPYVSYLLLKYHENLLRLDAICEELKTQSWAYTEEQSAEMCNLNGSNSRVKNFLRYCVKHHERFRKVCDKIGFKYTDEFYEYKNPERTKVFQTV